MTAQYSTYDFLLTFHSNHGPILSCFKNTARCWLKSQFSIPHLYLMPQLRWPIWISQLHLVQEN